MSNVRARILVFAMWSSPFFVMILFLELAPAFRRGVIAPNDGHAALMKMAALYVPILIAFSTYWFGRGTDNSPALLLPKERWLTAVLITLAYQIVIIVLVMYATCGEAYPDGTPPITFNDWITNILQIGLLMSPFATAPVAFLLGVEKIDVVPGPGQANPVVPGHRQANP